MPFAARISDNHMCPMLNPDSSPHVGGPIQPSGVVTVRIGGLPAATVGSVCVCAGPPDSILQGSMTVKIAGQPAARIGDPTVHGGSIISGCFTVSIGG
ncbi:MAG: PAAR domain-containing protein [Chlorobiaceae bacterium]|nr:PAAR domain-containing protein [Chlorobiaceae bacterium]